MINMEMIGHACGVLGVCALIASYQFKKKSMIMLLQTCGTVFFILQFLFLGERSGLVLNGMCLVRNVLFCFRDKMGKLGKVIPFICGAAILVVGVFIWEGYPTLFLMVGLAVNTVCLGICAPQGLRASLLLSCALIIVYDVLVFAPAGVVNEVLSIISAVIGLVRYRKQQNEAMPQSAEA